MLAARSISTSVSTRDRILDATERLLARLGYEKTTMDDLAREAGISKRTIYLHFASKEEVALASIDRIVDRLCARLETIAAGPSEPGDQLKAMLLCGVLFRFDSVRDYYHSLDDLFASLRPAYMKRRDGYFAAEAAIFAKAIQAGIARKVMAPCDARAVANALLVATNSLLPYGLTTKELGKRSEIEKKTAAVADLLINGLSLQG